MELQQDNKQSMFLNFYLPVNMLTIFSFKKESPERLRVYQNLHRFSQFEVKNYFGLTRERVLKVIRNLEKISDCPPVYAVKVSMFIGSCILIVTMDERGNYECTLYGSTPNPMFELLINTLKFVLKYIK